MTPYWVYYVRLGRPHYHSRSPIMTIRFQGGKIDPYLDQLIDDYRSNPHNKDGLVYINNNHLNHAQFVEGLKLKAEKEM